MRSVCLYFQVHQPFRLRTYRFFDMGIDHYYYDDFQNKSIVRRVAEKCYLPANKSMMKMIRKHGKSFNVAYSISGLALEQFKMYAPEVIESFRDLADTGNVEFLAETYAHSLAGLRHESEFIRQVEQHSNEIKNLFGQIPVTFRNTELIYSDAIGETVARMGYKALLTEGAKHILGWKSPNYLYHHPVRKELKLLLKNFRLSDDIAFRFSNKGWSEWPLTAEKYAQWLKNIDKKQQVVNLFMDYETFGEHQWKDSGIFNFLEALPGAVLKNSDFVFLKPMDIATKFDSVSGIQVPYPISWADQERDLTAWLGNEMQDEAYEKLYQLADKMKFCNNQDILKDWNYLQVSDHFYYMCTKWFSDGDVHRYFNPYPSPYEAFINYMNVLSDFMARIEDNFGMAGPSDIREKTVTGEVSVNKATRGAKQKIKTGAKNKKNDGNDASQKKIVKLPDAKVKSLIKKLDIEELTYFLKDSGKEIREKIIRNMPKNVRQKYDLLSGEIKKISKSDMQAIKLKIETDLSKILK